MNFMDAQETLQTVPRWRLEMDAPETITLYQSLTVYLRTLSNQPDPPTESIKTVVYLMEVLKPSAVQAAQFYRASQLDAPN